MNGLSAYDREQLERIACAPGSIFSSCYRFTSMPARGFLLAMHALLSEIGAIPVKVSDPGIAKLKIAWWKNELTVNPAASQHPVIRALAQTGALESLDKINLGRYIRSVEGLTTGLAIGSFQDLLVLSRGIGGAALLLEMPGDEYYEGNKAAETIGAAGYLLQLLTDFSRCHCNDTWWLPMDLRARFEISSVDGKNAQQSNQVVRWVAKEALAMLNDAVLQLKRPQALDVVADQWRYVGMISGLQARRLRKLSRHPDKHTSNLYGPGEVMTAWWLAVRSR